MFEWTKLCHSGKDMSGTGGRMLKVSPEELAAHSSDKDIWTSVRGMWVGLVCRGRGGVAL